MADLFISYSRRDAGFVRRLAEALAARDKDAWVDWEDIPPTAEWFAEIAEGIDGADAFVYVISPDSVASEVCAREIAHATLRSKRVIPILLRRVPDEQVPEKARAHNWISFEQEADFEPSLATLVQALETDLDWVKGHTRWLGAALDWDRSRRDRSRLLRGSELTEAEAWLASSTGKEPEPTELQNALVYESRRGAVRRQRGIVAAVSAALVVALVLAVVALAQRSHAIDQKQTAQARALDSAAVASEPSDPELSLLLATKAEQDKPSADSRNALLSALVQSRVRARFDDRRITESAHFSPDGRLVSTTTALPEGATRIWDAHGGHKPVAVLQGNSNGGQAAFSPDGTRIATAGSDGAARIWNPQTGKLLKTLKVDDLAQGDLAWSPDGTQIATASAHPVPKGRPFDSSGQANTGPAIIRLWDVAAGAVTHEFTVGHHSESSLGFSGDGTALGIGTSDGRAGLWNTKTGRPLHSLPQPAGSTFVKLAFSKTGDRVATLSTPPDPTKHLDATGIRVWDTRHGRLLAEIPRSIASSVAMRSDGGAVAFFGVDALGEVYNVDQHRAVTHFSGLPSPASLVSFGAFGTRIATSTSDGRAQVWNFIDGSRIADLAGHEKDHRLTALEFSPDGRSLLTASTDGTARIWSLAPAPANLAHAPALVAAKPSVGPYGRLEAIPLLDGSIRLQPLPSGTPRTLPATPGTTVAGTVFNRDGTRLLSAEATGAGAARKLVALTVWRTPGGVRLAQIATPAAPTSANLSPDGRSVIASLSDGTAAIWDASTGHLVRRFRAATTPIFTAVLSDDGRTLLTGGAQRTAILWDADTGRRLHVLRGHGPPQDSVQDADAGVTAAAISHDGRTAATGGADAHVRTWDVATGRALQDSFADTSRITSVTFSPDDSLVASGSTDGTLTVWLTPTMRRSQSFQGFDAAVTSPALQTLVAGFGTSGRDVATIGGGNARMWDVATGQRILDVSALSGAFDRTLTAVVVNPQVGVGQVQLYRCGDLCGGPGQLLALARQRTTRPFTAGERSTFLHER